MTAREAAYLALLASLKQEEFISRSLERWMCRENPSKQDYAFAYEIASGAARMALALDHIGAQLSTNQKLSLKVKERALLRTAIYQYYFMEKVPLYAIVNETIEIAKKYCHKTFVSFLNALLRRLDENQYSLPSGNQPRDLSIRYSYPLIFVNALVSDYGHETAEGVLKAGNIPPKVMVKVRPGVHLNSKAWHFLKPLAETVLPVAIVEKNTSMAMLGDSSQVYIQNVTPVALVVALAERSRRPERILDLCASPGGKLLAAHDLYPQAKLFANDVSQEKIQRLSHNLMKYGVEADLSCGPGEIYQSHEKFDVIILDVPCSNSGVFNKRPEARWRLTAESLQELKDIQMKLLGHAAGLLSPGGVVWYLTCSILCKENEELLKEACARFGLVIEYSQTVLPNEDGWDGGFGALLRLKSV